MVCLDAQVVALLRHAIRIGMQVHPAAHRAIAPCTSRVGRPPVVVGTSVVGLDIGSVGDVLVAMPEHGMDHVAGVVEPDVGLAVGVEARNEARNGVHLLFRPRVF